MDLLLQTNSKAELATELDTLRWAKNKKQEDSSEALSPEKTYEIELSALQDAVRERDRTIVQLKEQMKHYKSALEHQVDESNVSENSKLLQDLKEAQARKNLLSLSIEAFS